MADEWFRSPAWSAEVEQEFERRLGRARTYNRPQYLRIKGLVLVRTGNESERLAGRALLRRVIDTYPHSFDVVIAHEALGESFAREGVLDQAEVHYRTALDLSQSGGMGGDAALRLPELLIERGGTDRWAEAESILDGIDPEQGLVFVSQRFRYSVARARLAEARGDDQQASEFASAALRLAAITTPDFSRHPTVGLVHADESVLEDLRNLVQEA